ncbi:hypothetical protein KEM55_008409 [Ascosphaera atra]|nr:hypothetical protein KEM55_008409 [Ascosphaera atra]
MNVPRALSKRVMTELEKQQAEPSEVLERLGLVDDDDLTQWEAVMKGIPSTPYEDGRWLLSIKLPPEYPRVPPQIRFKTKICHPNIEFATGKICLTLLTSEHWSPVYNVASTLEAVYNLLMDPGVDSPYNLDVNNLIRDGDEVGWYELVRYWTTTERYEGK